MKGFKDKKELEKFEAYLVSKGYVRFRGHFKSEDYGYWKSFDVKYDDNGDKEVGYQIAILIYDFSKYEAAKLNPYSCQFDFISGSNGNKFERVDMSITDSKISIGGYEGFCEGFYKNFIKND